MRERRWLAKAFGGLQLKPLGMGWVEGPWLDGDPLDLNVFDFSHFQHKLKVPCVSSGWRLAIGDGRGKAQVSRSPNSRPYNRWFSLLSITFVFCLRL